MSNRRAGLIALVIDGVSYDVKGNVTYNLGSPKRDALVGATSVHGYKETNQVPFAEFEVTDREDLDVKALQALTDSTVEFQLANGKAVVIRNAWYASEGDIGSEEGNIAVRFEGLSAEEL